MEHYAKSNHDVGNWMFEMEPAISPKDLEQIVPFTESYASILWVDHISLHRHLMLSDNSDWVNDMVKTEYSWMDDWNACNIRGLADYLDGKILIESNERVWFFWMRGSGVETTWDIFLRNWINFLYEDESPILYCPRTEFSMKFVSTGAMYIRVK